ncbi:MAG: hypothetical protein U5R30_14795 [Deltaproteobacteria bacterium]|nr:hypothetical protein [Deltaproteobacteria bacterium]
MSVADQVVAGRSAAPVNGQGRSSGGELFHLVTPLTIARKEEKREEEPVQTQIEEEEAPLQARADRGDKEKERETVKAKAAGKAAIQTRTESDMKSEKKKEDKQDPLQRQAEEEEETLQTQPEKEEAVQKQAEEEEEALQAKAEDEEKRSSAAPPASCRVNPLPVIGRLYRDHNIILTLYGRTLVHSTVIDILKAHRFARMILDTELTVMETYPLLVAMDKLDLAPGEG